MDAAKKIKPMVETVSKNSAIYIKAFSAEFIKSSVKDKLSDYLTTTIKGCYENAKTIPPKDDDAKQSGNQPGKPSDPPAKSDVKPDAQPGADNSDDNKVNDKVIDDKKSDDKPDADKPKDDKPVDKPDDKPDDNVNDDQTPAKKPDDKPDDKPAVDNKPPDDAPAVSAVDDNKKEDDKPDANKPNDNKPPDNAPADNQQPGEDAKPNDKPNDDDKPAADADNKPADDPLPAQPSEDTKPDAKAADDAAKPNDNTDAKQQVKDDDVKKDDKKVVLGSELGIPLINVSVEGYKKKLLDGAGKEHNKFDICYYKMTLDDNNPCRFGTTLKRYSRLRTFDTNIKKKISNKTLVSQLKFPGKSFAFWKANDDTFLKERQNELNAYFQSWVKSKILRKNKRFQTFLNLQQDPKRINNLKIFRSALCSTSKQKDYRIPSSNELNKYENEPDMLCYAIMIGVKATTKTDVDDILGGVNAKLKNRTASEINKGFATAVQKSVDVAWPGIKTTKTQLNKGLDTVINKSGDKFEAAINKLMAIVVPIIQKKLGKKKKKDDDQKSNDDDDDDDDDQKVDQLQLDTDLKVDGMEKLKVFLNKLAANNDDNSGVKQLYEEYIADSPLNKLILPDDDANKDNATKEISKKIFNTFLSKYGKYIKIVIKNYGKYEKDSKLICDAIANIIQITFKLTNENILLLLTEIDNGTSDKKELIKLLKKMGSIVAKNIGDEERKISTLLQPVNTDSSAVVLEASSILIGLIGNLLTNLVWDHYNKVNFADSLTTQLNKYLSGFVAEILNRFYKSLLSLLLAFIKEEISETIDKTIGDKLEFDFLPSALPDSLPQTILENIVYILIKYFLKKSMDKKNKKLQIEFYTIIRKN